MKGTVVKSFFFCKKKVTSWHELKKIATHVQNCVPRSYRNCTCTYILDKMRFVRNVFTKVLIAMRKHHGHQMHLVDRNATCVESMILINH